MTAASPDSACSAAVSYAENGWFVVPLHGINEARNCTCPQHRYCRHGGKHPFGRLAPHGAKDASGRPPIVARWFSIYPWLNVGVVPGPSRLLVVDDDPRNYGSDATPEAVTLLASLPETLTVVTGGGGRHFYFTDLDRCGTTRLLAPGLELKAGRSLLVAPPSRHKSGACYRWLDAEVPLAPAPEWLMSRDRP